MRAKQQDRSQHSLFFSLESTLNHKHPLFILANKIDWEMFEREFSPLYCPDNGRPAKPIRLMVDLFPTRGGCAMHRQGKRAWTVRVWGKVSITRTGTGVIVGALSFRNEFDGHTLDKAIEQVEKLTGRKPRNGICDRGYRGRSKVMDTLMSEMRSTWCSQLQDSTSKGWWRNGSHLFGSSWKR